jgi:methyl-accepting chemotaxis protein
MLPAGAVMRAWLPRPWTRNDDPEHGTAAVLEPAPGAGPELREALLELARQEAAALEACLAYCREELQRVEILVSDGAATLGSALRGLDLQVQEQYRRVLAVQEASLWVEQHGAAAAEPDGDPHRLAVDVIATLDSLMNCTLGIVESIRQVTAGVNEVRQLSARMEQNLDELVEIAARTTLLSLNANIEAAHARQYGAGFAVVAGEVSKLAVRSTGLNDGIQALIQETHQALARTSAQVSSIASQDLDLAMASKLRAESVVKAIFDSTTRVKELVEELRHSAQEIEDQVGNVVRGIQFDDLTRQTLGQVRQALAALERRAAIWRRCEAELKESNMDPLALLQHLTTALGEADLTGDWHRAVSNRGLAAGEVDLF